MRTVKLYHPGGHPFWQSDEYRVQKPDGSVIDVRGLMKYGMGYKVYIRDGNIYFRECACGSGYGKKFMDHVPEILLIKKEDYDTIEYIGAQNEYGAELLNDLSENNIS